MREPGVYAAVVGGTFVAGATEGQLPRGVAQQLAQAALASQRGKGTDSVLSDFVARVGRARTGESGAGGADDDVGSDDGGGGGGGWIVVALIALAGVGVAVTSRRRRRNRQEAALAGVRAVARDDVVTLGEEIRALDLDMEMPDADPRGQGALRASGGALRRGRRGAVGGAPPRRPGRRRGAAGGGTLRDGGGARRG